MKNFVKYIMVFVFLWCLCIGEAIPSDGQVDFDFYIQTIKKELRELDLKIEDYQKVGDGHTPKGTSESDKNRDRKKNLWKYYQKNISSKNKEGGDFLEYCHLLIKRGRYNQALYELGEIPKTHIDYWNAKVLALRIYMKTYRFDRLEEGLRKIKSEGKHESDLLCIKAEYALKSMNYKQAKRYFEILCHSGFKRSLGLWGLAKVEMDNYRFEESEKLLEKCLSFSPDFGPALELLAEIFYNRQEWDKYEKLLKKAFLYDPLNSDLLAKIAFFFVQRKRSLSMGANIASLALELDRFNYGAHHYLGRGYTPVFYSDFFEDESMEKRIARGNIALGNGKFKKAKRIFNGILKSNPLNPRALIGSGYIDFYNQKFDRALGLFFRVLEERPNYGLAHYCITQVLNKKKEGINKIYPKFYAEFQKKNPLPCPGLELVFINYGDLDRDLQKIIRDMVQPVRKLVKGLVRSGMTFYFMDMYQFLWECPYLSTLKGKRSIDLRLMDDLKGQGGYHGSSNCLQQGRVKYGDFNVAAHELGHMIHSLLPGYLNRELQKLFCEAKAGNKTLDYYSALNVEEYFAQGYEAYVSLGKHPGLSLVASHTQRELAQKDPKLFTFIDTISQRVESKEMELRGVLLKASYIKDLELREKFLQNARKEFGYNSELLVVLGNNFRERGKLAEALDVHRKIVSLSPENEGGVVELARDIVMDSGDLSEALALMKQNYSRFSDSLMYLSRMGEFYYLSGDSDSAEKMLNMSIELNPYPDPYENEYISPYRLMAMIYSGKGYDKESVNILETALNHGDYWDSLWAEIALAYLGLGEIEKGKRALQTAIKIDKDGIVTRLAIARSQILENDRVGARTILLENLKRDPFCWRSRLMLVEILGKSEASFAASIIKEGIKYIEGRNGFKKYGAVPLRNLGAIPCFRLYKGLEDYNPRIGKPINRIKN